MEEDTEYLKQSLEDRLVHKLWKARVHGYEEAAKLFRVSDDDKELSKFMGLVKKFVSDSNAAAQERGLEAALAFAENYQHAGKNVGEVLPCLVNKCLSAPKTRTRELSASLTLMYFELEKGEQVVEELLKGADHKNPKTQSACIAVLTQALREFGSKAVPIKSAVPKLPPLLEHRDKGVRDETRMLAQEMRRWLGPGLRNALAPNLKPAQLAEIDTEFEKVAADKPTPTRYLRSQQKKQERLAEAAAEEGAAGEEEEEAPEVDPLELVAPVDVLAALPKDLMEKLEAKKWQERKEALDQLETLLGTPKIAPGDFADLVRALKKVVSKDSNVVVVAGATRCIAALAKGLAKRFAPYSSACITPLLEKFKEKKPAVVTALREAVDAVLVGTNVEAIQEDVLAALDSKNPQVKTETASFLARGFTHCTPAMLNKKLLKAYFTSLAKLLADPDPAVRDAAADALGTALKVVGEKAVAPLWVDLDAAKQTKIRDCAEKAVIVAKAPRPASAPAKTSAPAEAKPVARRPATAAPSNVKKAVVKKPIPSAPTMKPRHLEMSAEELEEKAALIFTDDTLANLSDANWKTRLAAMESVVQTLGCLDDDSRDGQVLLSAVARKPGLRDTNFQVLRVRLDAVKILAEIADLSGTNVEPAVRDITLSLGDAKNGSAAVDALAALATSAALGPVALAALESALAQKSPKVQVEALQWVTTALQDFGPTIDCPAVLSLVRRALDAASPAVRAAAVALATALGEHFGQMVYDFFSEDPPPNAPTLLQDLAKFSGEDQAAPSAGPRGGGASSKPSGPKTDISAALDDKLMAELADKNWKVRMEALQRVSALVTDRISGSLGELPALLCKRLQDSNAKIAATALTICTALASAMGQEGRRHLRTFFPAIVLGLGDSKAWIREAALACLAAWESAVGVKEFFAGGEMVAASLDSGSPQLRAELCAWLATALTELPSGAAPKEELVTLIAPVVSALDDRSADVRKSGNAALGPLMAHVGFQAMSRHAEKLKPASRPAVVALLEKARHTLPVPAEMPSAAPANRAGSATMTRAKPSSAATKKVGPGLGTTGAARGAVGGGRKKEEEDSTPALQSNKLKNQRSIDEQKLKVLKWNFVTPRDEFVELLRDQLTTAGASKTLIANMFHADFKYHLKAIDQLSECLAQDELATEANLDLILKWMTLRFFDTNPSVLLKGLDYLQATFEMLFAKEYHMFETEASSFLPYLIVKVGDPKDAVRNGVRALVKLTDRIYPRTKLFQYLLDGIKSKNARQRTECLELLGYLLERYGLQVCGVGSPAPALREIARQISDRDNSVRNAALNCVVHAYHLEGDRVLKMLGQIGDKELSLLEERIKRSAGKKMAPKPGPPPRFASVAGVASQGPQSEDIDVEPEEEEPEEEEPEEAVVVAAPRPSLRRGSTLLERACFNSANHWPRHPPLVNPPLANPPLVTLLDTVEEQLEISFEVADNTNDMEASFQFPEGSLDETMDFDLPRKLKLRVNHGWRVAKKDGVLQLFAPEDLPNETLVSPGNRTTPVDQGEEPDEEGIACGSGNLTFTAEPAEEESGSEESDVGTAVVKPRSAPGPFGLDSHFLDQLEAQAGSEPLRAPHLHEFDLQEFRINGPPLLPSIPTKHGFPTLSPPRPLSRYDPPSERSSAERLVAAMSSSDLRAAIVAMNALDAMILTDAGAAAIHGKADAILCAAAAQVRQLRQTEPSALVSKAYRTLLMVLMSLCKVGPLISATGKCSLKSLLEQLLRLLAEDGLSGLEGHQQLTRVVNMLVVRLVDKTDHTQLLCALITLLDESITSGSERHQELVMKCVWKVLKLLPTWDSLECNVVLHDMHTFFKEHPGSFWRSQPPGRDLPLRTIKTVLHALVKLHGSAILAQLDLVDDAAGSELASYLEKLVKAVRMEGPRPTDTNAQQQQHQQHQQQQLSKSLHNLLADIFKKIGSKETTQDGLADLYDFRQANPEADIEPFLAKSSPFFKRYIEDGMRAIGSQRAANAQPDSLGNEPCHEASYFLNRLRSLQQQAGIETATRDEADEESVNNRLNEDKQELSSILRPAAVPTATDIDQLRLRLDAVKGTNRLT